MYQDKTITDFKEIWKETFGDSDEYVDLVYDNYYGDHCLAIYREGKMASALTGIPYRFGKQGREGSIDGLYLCGLATRPEFRRHGLMRILIEKVERQAQQNGMDFTFLIPADNHLREYYARLGYRSVMNRGRLKIGRESDFCENRIFAKDDTVSLKFSILAKGDNLPSGLLDFIIGWEKVYPGVSIRHSRKDLGIVIEECLLSGGKVYMTQDAVATVENHTVGLFMAGSAGKAAEMLLHLIYMYGELTLLLPENSPIWGQLGLTPEGLEPYVMFKSINGRPLPEELSAYRLLD